jgi:hypothetical protein
MGAGLEYDEGKERHAMAVEARNIRARMTLLGVSTVLAFLSHAFFISPYGIKKT